ncbi:MAG TPA: HAD family phosphatase [Azospirillaceae bacterium]|nr:HAD family phosphatase [Azospirillaceae bacterium]
MPAKIAAVIFDMDGVLIDAREWHYEALNRALRLFGYEISRYDHLHAYDGLPTRKKLEMLSRQHGLPVGLHGFVNELKQRYTLELVHARCKPTFAHEYALARLKEDGRRLGLASNSVRRTVETMMAYANLTAYFDVMLSNEDVERPKPDPEIYCKAAAKLGVAPEQCLVVEDNAHGIQAARAAGAHVLEVAAVEDVTYDAVRRAVLLAEGSPPDGRTR